MKGREEGGRKGEKWGGGRDSKTNRQTCRQTNRQTGRGRQTESSIRCSKITKVSYQNALSPLYIMLEIHHSGREPWK